MTATITCRDWRTVGPAAVAGLLAREADAWRRELSWDVGDSWRQIEPARAAGVLPGVVAIDRAGTIAGWSWFLRHRDCLQVASLAASSAGVVRALVGAIFESEAARGASEQVWCVRGTPPGLAAALERAGLAIAEYDYLSAPIDRADPAPTEDQAVHPCLRPWGLTDRSAVIDLCRRAYRGATGARAFAPGGSGAEWRDYLAGLLGGGGCGTWIPEASFVADDGTGGLAGAILTSAIARDVAHVPQIVVAPEAQGRGLGRRLLGAARRMSHAGGFRLMTLLVAASNRPARALYARAGFSGTRQFLVASSQPRRFTSAALATGGVSTRR